MSKFKKYVASFLFMILLACFVFPVAGAAAAEIDVSPTVAAERRLSVFEQKIDTMQGDTPLTMQTIKTVYDFDNNVYTLIECSPTGYLLFHDESGIFVEYSPESPSPFLNKSGQLYYGGPTEYYYDDGQGMLRNTLNDRTIPIDDVSLIAPQSKQVNDALLKNADKTTVNYLTKQFSASSRAVAPIYQEYYIDGAGYLSGLTQCGFVSPPNTNGICGYIAAALLLYYFKVTGHRDTMSEGYYFDGGFSSKFSLELYELGKSLGYSSNTTSVAIHNTVREYLNRRGITSNVSHLSRYAPLFTTLTITGCIDKSEPVILFGNLYSPNHGRNVNHAVLAYGYQVKLEGTSATYTHIVHFGYTQYYKVYLSGVIASIYSLHC